MVHSKTLFQGSNIIKNDLGRFSLWNNEVWSLFIEEKSHTSRWGFDRLTSRWEKWPLGLNRTSTEPQPDFNRTSISWGSTLTGKRNPLGERETLWPPSTGPRPDEHNWSTGWAIFLAQHSTLLFEMVFFFMISTWLDLSLDCHFGSRLA